MNRTSQIWHHSGLTELESLSTEDQDEEEGASSNYVLSGLNHKGLGCYMDAKPCVSWCSPARPSCNTIEVSTIQEPRTSEFELAQSLRSLGLGPDTSLQENQSLVHEVAIRLDVEGDFPTPTAQLAIEPNDLVPCNLDVGNEIPPGVFHKNHFLCRGEASNPPTLQSVKSTASNMMKTGLKNECWFGIGSWSKDNLSPASRASDDAMKKEMDSVPPEIDAIFNKNSLRNITQCPSGQRRQPSRSSSQTYSTAGSRSSPMNTNNFEALPQEGPEEDGSEDGYPESWGREGGSGDGDSEVISPRLACPFNKHDPQFFSANAINGSTFRCCAGPGFKTIARVK